MMTLKEFESTGHLMIAAHRGSSGIITENTLAAFADAIDTGVNIIELDIQVTADNKFVVFHDFVPPGFNKKISELNYSDIRNIVIGTEADTDFDSLHIPLLEDVLKLAINKCYLMIEIKVNTGVKFKENIECLVDLIITNNYEMNTIFGSFSYDILKSLKTVNKDLFTAVLKIPGDDRLPSKIREDFDFDAYICSVDEINSIISDDVNKHGIFTGVYTVDDEDALNSVLQYDIRAIATNFPEKILNLLNKKKQKILLK
ncbi:MAG: glycerophosphodiester phosphodiesterase [Candidatus Kapaibacterium sp.]